MSRHLVFISGWGYRASVFASFKEKLPGYTLQLTDAPVMQRGHIDNILQQFAASLPRPAILIGWSLGGMIAIELCARFPDRFEKLVLLGSSTNLARDDEFSQKLKTDFTAALKHFHRLTCFPDIKIKNHMRSHLADESMQDTLTKNLDYLFNTELHTVLSNLKQPVLSLAGEHDAIMKQSPPHSIALQQAGHAFPFTHTDIVCQHILNFIEQPA